MSDKKQAIDPDLVRELAKIISDSGLSEIEVEHGDLRLRIARTLTAAPVTHMVAAAAPVAHAPAAPPPAAGPAPVADAASHPGAVPSPMVGTAYLSPEPGAPVFIKIGDTVTAGQTLMVVEAMKTFNPIPAPRAGKITAILVNDAQPVEYGEPLVILE
ncbi:acetyl-CoA carboxylase biotin carboxyl carrier protein [Terricaulis sp.]|uniref:acetyl-CoA carboxylase biotin carboxyl carrier protein n=1 Tax=Terricaulis sp. TaxID=2768686 RepID=UPI002AC65D84|nr:acetyl-CoA carboxylase biotin carboxyl carrier protein [Terricaulis sp.]MDZ4693053.1 acetyl-CoA carboxylase biotin carboxyl carrier protein [Terricaulis sp.]